MASTYEIEVKLSSAKNLKNVNSGNGLNRPQVVIWVDPTQKHSTGVAQTSDSEAVWDEKVVIQVPPMTTIDDTTLYIDVVHANTEPNNNNALIIGSAKLKLIEVDVGECVNRSLSLMGPSGRPQGMIEVMVILKDTGDHASGVASNYPAYGVPPAPRHAPLTTEYTAPPTAAYSAPSATLFGVPTSIQYNAHLNYGYGQVRHDRYGYVPVVFGSQMINIDSSQVRQIVMNIIRTSRRRSNHGLGDGVVSKVERDIL